MSVSLPSGVSRDMRAASFMALDQIHAALTGELPMGIAYNPTIGATSGTITAVTVNHASWARRYNSVLQGIRGTEVSALIDLTVTTVGTASGFLTATLPTTPSDAVQWIVAAWNVTDETQMLGDILTTDGFIKLSTGLDGSGTFPASNGDNIIILARYIEAAA